MLLHYLKLAYRNNLRDKSTFFINLVGLSTGLACALLIALWVADELKVDKFHEHQGRLYQAMTHHSNENEVLTGEETQGLLAAALQADFPEVELAVQTGITIPQPFILSVGTKKIKTYGNLVDSAFFQLFSYEVVAGDKTTFLKDKQSIVISEKLAKKIAGQSSPIGQTIDWEIIHFKGLATVTGVFKVPENSSQQFDFLLPFQVYQEMSGEGIHWGNFNAITYVLLNEHADVAALNKRLPAYIQEKADWDKISLFLAPYADKYLYGSYENGKQAGGRIEYVRLFSIIAFFILLIDCINFMNLSTAKSTRKLKAIGVRKTVGANRQMLIGQHLIESIFIAFIALFVALFLVYFLLPSFNILTGKQLLLAFNTKMIAGLLGITLLTGFFAGSYPAFYVSSFQPVQVLKGTIKGGTNVVWIRKSLVVFQFALSIILMVSVLVVYQQIQFIQNKNLGYDKENVLTFPKEGLAAQNTSNFISQLKNIPGIINASSTNHPFLVNSGAFTTGISWEGKNPNEEIRFANLNVYYDFIETLGVTLKEGRDFSKEFGAEADKIIINETAAKIMGLSNPIGAMAHLWGEDVTIIGVVKDFHHQSLHAPIAPTFFRFEEDRLVSMIARIEKGQEQAVLSQLQSFYQKNNPGYAFDYTFLDSSFDAQYKSEAIVGKLSLYFAILAILISCLGLFGLVSFSAQQRRKEIGIRKVLGASIYSIVQMLSLDFTKMVLLAIGIALPISYFLVQKWLAGFAFSIALQPWVFLVAGISALLIAWMTMGFHTTKAAMANPSNALKNE